MRVLEALKRANASGAPEESVAVRLAVFVAVMSAVFALAAEDIAGTVVTVAAILVIPVGFYISHRYRANDQLALKAGLAVALLVVLVNFLGALGPLAGGDITAVQVPLAEVFLWVQVLHALHVPGRRDLVFGLVASGVTFAVVGVLSLSITMAPLLLLWIVAATTALVLGHRDDVRAVGAIATEKQARLSTDAKAVARIGGVLAVTAAVVFVLLPAASTSRALAFPINLPKIESVASPGGLSNPSLGQGDPQQTSSDSDSTGIESRASFGYFGFAGQLDTSLRGRPDDTLVMRVRAPGPDFWRGQSFDTWDGTRWTLSDDSSRTILGDNPLVIPPTNGDALAVGQDFVATFYLERPGPNVIFSAARPVEVYFPDARLFQLRDGTLRAAVDLGAGAVYTVVSSRQPVTADLLRQADPLVYGVPAPIADVYLQLPDTPQRVFDLAADVTRDAPTTYDKVRALEAWMATNTTYSLDIPTLPAGEDAVDHYLFEAQQGFCEQIGTSLVVMLRSLGVPARLAVGYIPGERNPFTGMYEVRASDAHAWAEVWFPGVGWQSFDPTAKVPLAGESGRLAAAAGLIDWIQERLPSFVDTGMEALIVLGGVAALAGLGVVGVRIIAAHKRKRNRDRYEQHVWRLERLGARCGRSRRSGETLIEYGRRLAESPLRDSDISSFATDLTDWQFSGGDATEERSLDDRIRRIERRHRDLRSTMTALRVTLRG
ncbi:MAG: hypothetical protein HKN07_14430 [Acidimicrobiia bacterium]|nr:hypothetical protein [Acidimicrobiia bacterium]